MKFIQKESYTIRLKKYFAIFPITIGKETRWLEFVYVIQRYDEYDEEWEYKKFITKFEYSTYNKLINNHGYTYSGYIDDDFFEVFFDKLDRKNKLENEAY